MRINQSFTFKVALRNLSRKPRRTLLLLVGLAVANALIIWILTFRENASQSLMNNVLGMKHGYEQITSPGHFNFDKKSMDLNRTFNFQKITEKIGPDFPYTLRAHSVVMLASEMNALPANLNGYDLEREMTFSKLGDVLKEKNFTSAFPLILGQRLADKLKLKVGDEVAVIGQALDGSVANELFTVEKILDLGGGTFDAGFAVTPLNIMQNFLVMNPQHAHILVNFSQDSLRPLSEELGLEIWPWQKILPDVAASSGFMSSFTKFYVIFLLIVASMAMGNTLALSFLERTKEYRMSTIIGTPRGWLRQTLLIETFLLGLFSLILGNIIVLILITIFHYFPLSLTILTRGEALRVGGMIIDQKIKLIPIGEIFVICNSLFILTLMSASIYPVKVVLKKAQEI